MEQYKMGWGVDYCLSLSFLGITGGESLVLSEIALVDKDGKSSLSLLEPFLGTVLAWQAGGSVQPFAFVQADGRVSDWPAMYQGSGSRTLYSVAQMAEMLSYIDGITITNIDPPDDGYHQGWSTPALMLGGCGSTYDWAEERWVDWIDVPLSDSPIRVPAQDLFDVITGYPGIGNPFDGSGYPGPDEDDSMPLATRKILRGQGTGLVFNSDGTPHEGLAVSAWATAGTFAGVGMTGADGSYRTGSPFGPGNRNVATFIDGTDPTNYSATTLWQNRQRVRTAFRIAPVPCEGTMPSLFCMGDGSTLSASAESCSIVGPIRTATSCGCDQPYASGLPSPNSPGYS